MDGRSGTAGGSGTITLRNVAAGAYSFVVEASGYLASTGTVTSAGADTTVQVTLIRQRTVVSLLIHAFDLATGTPVVGSSVRVAGVTLSTDSHGDARINQLPAGSYPYSIDAASYKTVSGTAVLAHHDMTVLAPLTNEDAPTTLTLRVTDGVRGEPIAGAAVRIGDRQAVTDDAGIAVFLGMTIGTFNYGVAAAGYD
ncbi:MAG: hypothetical protein AABY13_02985, partial [Nanoarchaeota archaeon]